MLPYFPGNEAKSRLLICLLFLVSASMNIQDQQFEGQETDIFIYGGTPAGVAAALAAAKSNKKVTLVDPGIRLGGMLTNGLSHTDFHSMESLSGTYLAFSERVEAYYIEKYGEDSEQVKTSYKGNFGEPKVNLLILEAMLAEYANISIYQSYQLKDLSADNAVLQVATLVGKKEKIQLSAKIFIDATYEGDLMEMAGVPYQVGREGKNVFGESLAPDVGDNQLQGYNFRFCATNVASNRAEVRMPDGYLRSDFLGVIPILNSGSIKKVFDYPKNCVFKAHLPALPNHKYDINDVSNGQVRLSMPGRNLGWPEGDAKSRQQIFSEHLRYNVGLLYFLQNDPDVPEKFQEEALQWGWCKDEFPENEHLPTQLYIREARRMQGKYVFTQKDGEITPGDVRTVLHEDAIAMGDYGNNCHGTFHEGPLIGGRHTGEFYHVIPPYQIPYGVMLSNEFENLLVPGAVSSSHVGFCALRLEPIWMSLGQAAGHAAALALETEQIVGKVDVSLIQRNLHLDGSATIYTSDVLPGNPDFVAVQWWGTLGGLHGLSSDTSLGVRGKNLHGQYYEAAPLHEADLDLLIEQDVKSRWIALTTKLGINSEELEVAKTRGEFIRFAHQAEARN